jgi:ABC-type Mn2+/Zn2+ transport system permease subunit
MKNDANWTFANKEMAKFSLIIGCASTIAGILSWHFSINPKHVAYSTIGLILISIVIVETRLSKFDKSNK